jgi:hypothetical protein
MEEHHRFAGGIVMIASLLGSLYLLSSLGIALASGVSRGRMGAIHHAWSTQYVAYLVACVIGLVLMAGVAFMGARWMGWFPRKE